MADPSPTSETDAAAEVVRLRPYWAVRGALSKLYDACMRADAQEDLGDVVSGELLDEVKLTLDTTAAAFPALAAARAQPTAGVGEALGSLELDLIIERAESDAKRFSELLQAPGKRPSRYDIEDARNHIQKLVRETRRLLAASPGATTAQTEGAVGPTVLLSTLLDLCDKGQANAAEQAQIAAAFRRLLLANGNLPAALSPAQTAPRDDVEALRDLVQQIEAKLDGMSRNTISSAFQQAYAQARDMLRAALRAVPAPEGEVR